MSTRTTKILAVAVVILFAAVFLMDRQGDDGGTARELLFPELKGRLDEIGEVTITDADGKVTVVREGERWIVPGKGGYRADTAALRELLIAIAEARKVEEKTSNSEFYQRLGVEDPEEEGSTGVLVTSAGLGADDFSLILGDPAQREYRYARVAGEAESWLIDRNPEIPKDAGGWLASDIADIASTRIQSVAIAHEDGESVRIRKENEDATNFEVEVIPEGRELSYPSVANSIAAALDNLTLEDVRPEAKSEGDDGSSAMTTYTTFDGLQVTVASRGTEDETWVTLEAQAVPVPGGGDTEADQEAGEETAPDGEEQTPAGDGSEAASPEDADGAEAESPSDPAEPAEAEAVDPEEAPEAEAVNPAEQAAEINARVSGWEYRIPQYKANQLRRRWEDLLADTDTGEE
jgi:hypothetical protein